MVTVSPDMQDAQIARVVNGDGRTVAKWVSQARIDATAPVSFDEAMNAELFTTGFVRSGDTDWAAKFAPSFPVQPNEMVFTDPSGGATRPVPLGRNVSGGWVAMLRVRELRAIVNNPELDESALVVLGHPTEDYVHVGGFNLPDDDGYNCLTFHPGTPYESYNL